MFSVISISILEVDIAASIAIQTTMTSQLYPTAGLKGFESKPDVEAYLAAFSADEFDTYFQYYHPDIYVSASTNKAHCGD